MMTLSNHFKDRFPGARPGSVIPKPYTFTWFEQQLAAFLLIRGRYAFFGTGWGLGLVHEWQSMYDTDFGVPLRNGTADGGVCFEVRPGVFHRPWSKYNITLDCNTWQASFDRL